jgi:ABC-2 type transport system ATP-binding protein
MEAIRAEGLARRFGEIAAVEGLNLRVAAGEIYGLVGPDGAGKSTTLRMLASILTPSAGHAWVAGYDVATQADQVKDHIAYMSQQFGLYGDLTVRENIEFYADLYGVPARGRAARIDELLGFSQMQPYRRRLAVNLSGGMKQKLQLICALIHTPQVLLLDEPTNGVDPVSRRDFWRVLYGLLRQGVAILVSTAYLDEAERCNRVGLLSAGRVFAEGTPAEVKRLMRGQVVELRTPRARQAAALLTAHLPGLSIALLGDRVHVATEDPQALISQARALLSAAGITLADVQVVEASLEDVFISVLGSAAEQAHA